MPDVFISNPSLGLPEKEPVTEKQKSRIEGHSHSFLQSLCIYPDDIDFETRESDEKIIIMLRKHIVTNFKWVIFTIILLFIPTLGKIFGVFSALPLGYGFVIPLAWYLVTSAYALENFLDWYFDVYFVTNMRIVEVSFTNLINKHVSGAIVDKVQDVTYTTSGVFRTLFNFGDVIIQTAAEIPEFDFFAVPSPERVAKIIDDLKLKTNKGKENL